MAAAPSSYGGIWEVNHCCVHPYEYGALLHWALIHWTTYDDYETMAQWNFWWAANTSNSAFRQWAFEKCYGFRRQQKYIGNPPQWVDVIVMVNKPYFDFLADYWFVKGHDCVKCELAAW